MHIQCPIVPFHRHAGRLEDVPGGSAHHRPGILALDQGHAQEPRLLVAAIRRCQPDAADETSKQRLCDRDRAQHFMGRRTTKSVQKRIFNRTRTEILSTNKQLKTNITYACNNIAIIICDFWSDNAYQQILLHRDRRLDDEILYLLAKQIYYVPRNG